MKQVLIATAVLVALLVLFLPARADNGPYLSEFDATGLVIRWENVPTEYCWQQHWATARVESEDDTIPWAYVYSNFNCHYEGNTLVQEWKWDYTPTHEGTYRPIQATIHPDISVFIPDGYEFTIYHTMLPGVLK